MSACDFRSVVALSGGVGGARFVDGLSRMVHADSLTVVVNTGDDFDHWGLRICPDVDTVMYTLGDLVDVERGWGVRDETFNVLAEMRRRGAPDWFTLGDRDLTTHLTRTDALRDGELLSSITLRLCRQLGVRARVLPMCEAPCPTLIETATEGILPFQSWFVRLRAEPAVRRVVLHEGAAPGAGVLDAIRAADLVLLAPSNPYVSVDPILSVGGVRPALEGKLVVAVSPIVAGRALKGPLASMIEQLTGDPASAAAVARHYGDILTGFVAERGDAPAPGAPTLETRTIMGTTEDRVRLARETLQFARALVG